MYSISLFPNYDLGGLFGAASAPVRVISRLPGQGWALKGKPRRTLRIRPVEDVEDAELFAVSLSGHTAVLPKPQAIEELRKTLPHLSLNKPDPQTVALLMEWGLVEVREGGRAKQRRIKVRTLPPREARVGFSEIAAVMGRSPFLTPLELWRIKRGLAEPEPPTFAMRWGTETEKTALRLWCEQRGVDYKRVRTQVPAADGVLAGTLDAIARLGDERVVVEVKVASSLHAQEAYRLQVNAQLGAVGLRRGFIVTVVAGVYMHEEEVLFDPELYERQKQAAERFLRCVQTGEPPLELYAAELQSPEEGVVVAEEGAVVEAVRRWREAEKRLEEAGVAQIEAEINAAKSTLREFALAAKAKEIRTPAGKVRVSVSTTQSVDTKRLRAEAPEVAEKYLRETQTVKLVLI